MSLACNDKRHIYYSYSSVRAHCKILPWSNTLRRRWDKNKISVNKNCDEFSMMSYILFWLNHNLNPNRIHNYWNFVAYQLLWTLVIWHCISVFQPIHRLNSSHDRISAIKRLGMAIFQEFNASCGYENLKGEVKVVFGTIVKNLWSIL